MSPLRHVIFDCDGVLVDSEPLANRLEVRLARDLGIAITPEEMARRFIGRTLEEQWSELAAENGLDLPDDVGGWIYGHAEPVFRAELAAIAGIETLLAGLALPASVASNSTTALLALKLEVTGLARHFAGRTHSCEDVAAPKPAPDLYLLAARVAGVDPAACAIIEDSTSGMRAAVAAGGLPIGFTGGSHQTPGAADRLRSAGARHVVNDTAELAQLLAELRSGDG